MICYNVDSFDRLVVKCENKTSCQVFANTNTFGDPCGGLAKQLFIQFQCVTHSLLATIGQCVLNANTPSNCPARDGYTLQTYCEPTAVAIPQCGAGQVLDIACALYGIDPTLFCQVGYYNGAPTTCYSTDSFSIVQSQCAGQSSCYLDGKPYVEVLQQITNV